jgi:hypothetical protein
MYAIETENIKPPPMPWRKRTKTISPTDEVRTYKNPATLKTANPAARKYLRPNRSEYDPANGCVIIIERENEAIINPRANPVAPSSVAKTGRNGTTNPMPTVEIKMDPKRMATENLCAAGELAVPVTTGVPAWEFDTVILS